jgi:hypothetical protein
VNFRNAAAHLPLSSEELTADDAKQYRILADKVLALLELHEK